MFLGEELLYESLFPSGFNEFNDIFSHREALILKIGLICDNIVLITSSADNG